MRSPKTEENRNGATVATFVLQEIGAMLGTHLGPCHIRTAATDKLLRIELFTNFRIATCLAAVISLLAFKAHVICITIHGQLGDILAIRILDDALIFDAAEEKAFVI